MDGDAGQKINGQRHEQAQAGGAEHTPPNTGDHQQNNDLNCFSISQHPHPQPQPPSSLRPPPQPLLPFQTPRPHPGLNGARYFTIQRVNGNGGNGKGDGVAGPHKHTLADSDKVKKNSVVRWIVREGKGIRKATGALRGGGTAQNTKKATGAAGDTIKKHSKAIPKDNKRGVVLLGDCTDIETQRVWIALEVLGIPYQYVETSSTSIISGLAEVTWETPAIRKADWTIDGAGAGVILEYLNEVAEQESLAATATAANGSGNGNGGAGSSKRDTGPGGMVGRRGASRTASVQNRDVSLPGSEPQNGRKDSAEGEAVITWVGATGPASAVKGLLPGNPVDRAYARHWAHFVTSAILPAYNAYLRASSTLPPDGHGVIQQQVVPGPIYEALKDAIVRLIAASHPVGPFFAGQTISLVDVVFAPIVLRLQSLLSKRGWKEAENGSRWAQWVEAIEGCEEVGRTCCDAEAYEQAWAEERGRMGKEGEMERRRSGEQGI